MTDPTPAPNHRANGVSPGQSGWLATFVWLAAGGVLIYWGVGSLTALGGWTARLGGLLLCAMGIVLGGGTILHLAALARFGKPYAEIDPGTLAPGDTFHFRFLQPVRLASRLRVTTAFVLRETRTYEPRDSDSHPEVKRFDSPVAVFAEPARFVSAEEQVLVEHELQVPPLGAEGYVVQDGVLSWVVKVRLQWGQTGEVWHEYDVPADVCITPESSAPADPGGEECYVVTLVRCPITRVLRVSRALQQLLPHFDLRGAGDLCSSTPAEVLRNVDRIRAERAREMLLGAGAEVAVLRGEELIPRPDTHHLPIPREQPDEPAGPLPVPGPAPCRVGAETHSDVQQMRSERLRPE
ncbi:MAG: hypothetical protein ACK47B_27745 [Armatimonadota bacterium]